MATLDEEIKAAEEKMRRAYAALIAYVNRSESEPTDIKLHCRLADDLTLANAHYLTLVRKQRASS